MMAFWLVMIFIFAVIEGATAGLTSIWFAIGALAAMITASAGGLLWLQIAVFIVVSIIALMVTRPLVKKYITPRKVRTNADRAIGRMCKVTESIDNVSATGTVTLDGVVWTARSEENERIEKDTLVTVTRIEGVKLYVVRAPVSQEAAAQ